MLWSNNEHCYDDDDDYYYYYYYYYEYDPARVGIAVKPLLDVLERCHVAWTGCRWAHRWINRFRLPLCPCMTYGHCQCRYLPSLRRFLLLILLGNWVICVWTTCPGLHSKAWWSVSNRRDCWSQVHLPIATETQNTSNFPLLIVG